MRTPAHTISNTVADTVYQSRGAQYAITLYASADTSMLPLAARKASCTPGRKAIGSAHRTSCSQRRLQWCARDLRGNNRMMNDLLAMRTYDAR